MEKERKTSFGVLAGPLGYDRTAATTCDKHQFARKQARHFSKTVCKYGDQVMSHHELYHIPALASSHLPGFTHDVSRDLVAHLSTCDAIECYWKGYRLAARAVRRACAEATKSDRLANVASGCGRTSHTYSFKQAAGLYVNITFDYISDVSKPSTHLQQARDTL